MAASIGSRELVRDRPIGSRQATVFRLTGLAQSDPDRDARQPRTERSVATPARQRTVRGHERLLRGVLGLVEVAEDPMAGPDDRRRLALDEPAEGISVARRGRRRRSRGRRRGRQTDLAAGNSGR